MAPVARAEMAFRFLVQWVRKQMLMALAFFAFLLKAFDT